MTDPILIIGAGPTGLTAAMELTRFGLPVRLVDRRAAPAATSRAIGVQARTLELLAQRGLSEELVRLGNPGRGGDVYGAGRRVFRLDFAHVDSPYPYILFVSQAETERVLREALARGGVVPEWSVELVAVSQDPASAEPSPVTAVLRRPDGTLEMARAPWLISAEGAHSLVRSTLDLPFQGRTLQEAYALGDLHLDGDLSDHDLHIFSSEHGFMGLFPMGQGRFRLIASHPLSAPAKGTAPSLAEIQSIYDQRSHIPARFHDLAWSSWFRINSRMVSRLKAGRFLLGGDSAHIHSPAGAQGMNTGMQDMINLGWKLAMVSKGEAAPALLDTYAEDRLPVMHDVLFKTERLTETIGTEDPVVRALFNTFGPWIGGAEPVQEASTARMSQVALTYREGPLSSNAPHAGAIKAGDRVPDLAVRVRTAGRWEETRLQSLLDPSRFVLLVAHGDASETASCIPAVDGRLSRSFELAPPSGEADAYRRQLGTASSAFLVRPDGYVAVAAGAHSAEAALKAFEARWFTPPAPTSP